jgi:hypothetical protein
MPLTPTFQRLTEPFATLGHHHTAGDYRFVQHWILFTTDPSKFLSLATDYKWGDYFNGKLKSS